MYKVVIAIPTMEMARQAKFYDYLFAIDKPADTVLSLSHGQSPAQNRNVMIQNALDDNATHVFFIDDDVLIPKDSLFRLLAHDKDIVSGLYLMRNFPHQPIAMDVALSDNRCRFKFLQPDEKGLVEVVNFGLGCCLIKTEVFKKMQAPWITIGQLNPQEWNDDIEFFNRCREKYGFRLWLDLDVRAGHMCTTTLWPHYNEEQKHWLTMYDTQGMGHAAFYAATPQQVYGPDKYKQVLDDSRHLVIKDLTHVGKS